MARTVIYANNDPFTIENDALTPAQIRDTMSEYFPELKNATWREEANGTRIVFEVKAGTKGARTVIYANNDPFTIENDNLTPAQIRDTMSEYFPELKNATWREEANGTRIVFEVKAGTKGIKGAIYSCSNGAVTWILA